MDLFKGHTIQTYFSSKYYSTLNYCSQRPAIKNNLVKIQLNKIIILGDI